MTSSPRASEWIALTDTNGRPRVRVLDDEHFDHEVNTRTTAYKQVRHDENGREDYAYMKACLLRFEGAPDELLLRKSASPHRCNDEIVDGLCKLHGCSPEFVLQWCRYTAHLVEIAQAMREQKREERKHHST